MKKKHFLKCICANKDTQVKKLDYSSSFLRQVPQEIFNHERTLESINLDNNNITELTKELFCCKALRELIISDNELSHLPEAIDHLSHLNKLNISKNNLSELPEKIGNCNQLVFLDASVNAFELLPDGLCRLTMLQELIVNTAFLTMLPHNIGRLVNLRHIELRENELKSLPENIGMLSSLNYLDVGNNDLSELPDSMCRLTKLTVFCADKNNIASLPEKIGSCSCLQVLELQQNCLTGIPESISQCVFLTDLVASDNKLHSLPASLGNLVRLKNLRVDNNMITALPDSIGQLDNIVEMYLSNNQLAYIPHSVGLLKRLRDLYADCNCLTDIPAEIGSCSSMMILSLRGNKILYLPDEIGRIPHLKMLNLSNNRVKFLPLSFLKLRELRAVWLNDNQIQPLVQLQSERDVDTGRKCLVCYLLPQMSNTDDPDATDNDPTAWQLVQDNRPRVVQWNDEATSENKVQSKGKMPKDAPAKQLNTKHTLARQNKPANNVKSHPINFNPGDCIMMSNGTVQHASYLGNQPMWSIDNNGANMSSQYYPLPSNGSANRRLGPRQLVGGYESDTAAMHNVRSWGRHTNQMLAGCQEGRLARIHESAENDSQNNLHVRPGTGAMTMMGPGGTAVGYGRHPAGGGMVGGRQCGYNTDSGLLTQYARNGQGRQVRRKPGPSKQIHYRNPFDQLRVQRSSDVVVRRYDPATISLLPPPPTRQPPQRPLPSPPPSGRINLLPSATTDTDQDPQNHSNTNNDHWHVQMANGSVPDSKTATMIIPPPPSRTPPSLAITYPDPITTSSSHQRSMIVDLYHPGLASISPSVIEDPANRIADNPMSANHKQALVTVTVIIIRDKGLGFSISGGISSNPNSFRPDDKGIFIAKVNPAGPADGRLRIGDKILMVNNTSFIGIEHSAAVTILKGCGDIVKMTVNRVPNRDTDI